MTTEWFLVKYVSDLLRDEARNIGVIVRGDFGSGARFVGETESGTFDGRRAQGAVASVDALREWIGYLRHHLDNDSLDRALRSLGRRSLDNYRVEQRGKLLRELSDPGELDLVVEELFVELVSTGTASTPDLKQVVNDLLFRQIKVPHGREIERDVRYTVQLRGQQVEMPFDYRYRNGSTTVIERLSLAGNETMATSRVNDLLFRIENVESMGINRFLAIYDIGRLRMTNRIERLLTVLQEYAFTVPARSEDAARQISESLDVLG